MPDVRLISDTGQAVSVDAADADYYLRQGFRPESGGDIVQAADKAVLAERQAGRGALDQVGAAFHGFMSGATFGASKVLEEGLGFGRDEQKALEQDFAKTTAISEIAGAVVPALVPGGQGSILKALPAGRAALMGERIAQVGEGASAWRKIAAAAKAGAVEGAAQTGGQYLSSVALGDRDLSAEAFLAETGKGALLGGGIGGGFAAAERGFVAARKLLPKSAGTPEAVTKAADDIDAQLTKALDGSDRAAQAARDKLEALRLQRADLDVAAQAKVAERRATEAALAEQRLATAKQLDEIRVAKAQAPKSSRPRSTPDAAAPESIASAAAGEAAVEATAPAAEARQSWREFTAGKMGTYMKSEGSHAAAMKRLGEEWKVYKAGGAAADAARPIADGAVDAAKTATVEVVPAVADGGDDLMALLSKTKAQLDDGASIGALNQQARRPVVDEIHEAMAELDPEAAALVNAAKAHDAAAAKIRDRFTIRDSTGTHRVSIPEMADMTLGRVKQAYRVANDAQKAEILTTIGPERAKALTEIVEGRAGFDKWYKNKNHWYEDPSYRATETIGPAPDDLAFGAADDAAPSFEGGTMTADDFADVDSMNRAAKDLAEYESTMAELVDKLGAAAPPDLVEAAAAHGAAVEAHAAGEVERMAQLADDMPIAPAVPEAPPVAAAVPAPAAAAGDPLKAASLMTLPGAAGLGAKATAKAGGMLADLAAANEALQTVGIHTPFSISNIPVIGPIASTYFKLRAALTVARKAGFRVPLVGDAVVAAGASKTRDRVAASVDRMLSGGAKAAARANTPGARMGAVAALPRAASSLRDRLYNDGSKRPAPKSDADALRARLAELEAATANPAGVQSTVRASLRDVRDPAVVQAVVDVAQRKLSYLAKHVPTPPIAAPLSRAQWTPAPADIERFARRVRAANDPAGVLDDVAHGTITAEAVETLREVYPRIYDEARTRLLTRAPQIREQLPHTLVVRMSALFDAPLISSMEPERIAEIQAIGASAPAPAAAPQAAPAMTPPPGGAPNVSDLFMTGADRRAR